MNELNNKRASVLDALCHKPQIVCLKGNLAHLMILLSGCKKPLAVQFQVFFEKQKRHSTFYDEEGMFEIFINKTYASIRELYPDVCAAYRMQIDSGNLRPAIRFLHQKLLNLFSLNEVVVTCLSPDIPVALSACVYEFGSFVRQHPGLIELLYETIEVSSAELEKVEFYRSICGISKWTKKKRSRTCVLQHWSFDWISVLILHNGCRYYERIDERLHWISVWLAYVRRNPHLVLQTTPRKMIIALLR